MKTFEFRSLFTVRAEDEAEARLGLARVIITSAQAKPEDTVHIRLSGIEYMGESTSDVLRVYQQSED